MRLNDGARDVVVEALRKAGYKGVWVHAMSGTDGTTAIVATDQPIEDARFTFGNRTWPKAGSTTTQAKEESA